MELILVSTVKEAFSLDFKSIVIGLIIILLAIVVVAEAIGKISKMIGKPVKWVRMNDKDHETVMKHAQDIEEMRNDIKLIKNVQTSVAYATKEEISTVQSNMMEQLDKIQNDVKDLKNMIVDDRVARMRSTILRTASDITNGQMVSKEQYEEALSVYDSYENFLKANKMSNGRVDISIKLIRDGYTDLISEPVRKIPRSPKKTSNKKMTLIESEVL